jgi:RHS repeat-associated protein
MKRILLCLFLLSCCAFSQIDTGMPPNSTMLGGPFDTINAGNLNIHFAVPIISKPGRGLPFTYALAYDSSIWTRVVSGSTTAWQPSGSWGWVAQTQSKLGYVAMNTVRDQCYDVDLGRYVTFWYNDYYAYIDWNGTYHPINIQTWFDHCMSGDAQTVTDTTTDGSGLTVTIDNGNATIKTVSGTVFAAPVSSTNGNGTVVDQNGNKITVSSGTYTDTLGSTALSISGSGPIAYSYIDSTGASRVISVNYTTKYIRTNFGCSGVGEYGTNGTTTASLVSSISLPNGTSYTFTYEDTPGFTGFVTGRIKQITLPTGGTISYSYTNGDGGTTGSNGIVCADGTSSGLTRTTIDTGSASWQYSRANVSGSQWKTTITEPTLPVASANQTVIYFQAVQNKAAFVETRRETYAGNVGATLLQTTETCYATTEVNSCAFNVANAVSAPIRTVMTRVTRGSHTLLHLTNMDGLGAVTSAYEYDYDNASFLRKTTTVYSDLTNGAHVPSSVTVYDGNNSPQAITNYTYDGGTLDTSTSGATQHDAVSGARGNVTRVTVWGGGTYLDRSTNYSYFDTGLVKSITDPGNHVTTFDYTDNFSDGTHNTFAFVTTVTKPTTATHPHVTHAKYFWPSGLLQQSTDENGQNTSYTYDASLRPLTITQPNGGQTTLTYDDTANIGSILVKNQMDGTNWTQQYTRRDGYGRPFSTNTLIGSGWKTQDKCFDAMGRTQFVTTPYIAALGTLPNCGNQTDGTAYAYDALGRTTSITAKASGLPNRVSSLTYAGVAVKTQDPGNGTRSLTKINSYDGLGNLSKVCEATNATQQGTNNTPVTPCVADFPDAGFVTTYSYTTLGQVNRVTQGGLGNRTYSYDTFGALRQVTAPETGTTTFGYSNEGLLTSRTRPSPNQTDPTKTVTTTYQYDEGHKLWATTYNDDWVSASTPDPDTPSLVTVYDATPGPWSGSTYTGPALTNLSGRVVQLRAYTPTQEIAEYTFSYDSVGNLIDGWYCTPTLTGTNCNSSTFNATAAKHMTYGYDLAGDLTSFNNSQWTLTYGYNAGQQLLSVTSSRVDATHPATILSANNSDYGRFGLGSYIVGGSINSGVQTIISYTNFGELSAKSAISSGGSGTTVFSMGPINYAPDGLITGTTVNSSSWTHNYDDFGRILSSQNGTSNPFNFLYDRYGNRTQQAQTGGSTVYTPTDNTTNKIAAGNGVSYDALGNITNDGVHSYTYDAENRLIKVDGGTAATYLYDNLNQRVQKVSGGTTADFLFDPDGNVSWKMVSGSLSRGEIFIGSLHVATYKNGHTYFMHTNWLGSESTRTDDGGNKVQDCEWKIFGELKSCSGTSTDSFAYSTYHYAGYERDQETGLDHMQYRYYNSRIGRFMSADLMEGSGLAPQSLNKFSYVVNSAVSLADPSGLCPLIIAGSAQSASSQTGKALIQFAQSIGANIVFPFDGKGKFKSLMAIQFAQNGPVNLTSNALLASNEKDSPVVAVAYSGGAQTLSSALNRNPDIKPLGIDYLSPGLRLFGGGPLAQGERFTNRYRGNGFVDGFVNFTAAGAPEVEEHKVGDDCGHDSGCAVSLVQALLANDAKNTNSCSVPSIFDNQSPQGRPIGGGGGDGGYLFGGGYIFIPGGVITPYGMPEGAYTVGTFFFIGGTYHGPKFIK